MFGKYLNLTILRLLPKNLLTAILGKWAEWKSPRWLVKMGIRIFSRIYHIAEHEIMPSEFHTFNEFFTRALKPECRPISQDTSIVVSPVDAHIGGFGTIQENTLFQAKGIVYSLEKLVLEEQYVQYFQNGSYITLYLSPHDYHRIHTPVSGYVREMYHIPGRLYPVNRFAVANVPGLFTLNERVITLLEHECLGKIAVIKIGATVVGKIQVTYDQCQAHCKNIVHRTYSGISLNKGQELGRFQLGSTVILLFQNQKIKFLELQTGQEIQLGNPIAQILPPSL